MNKFLDFLAFVVRCVWYSIVAYIVFMFVYFAYILNWIDNTLETAVVHGVILFIISLLWAFERKE